MTNGWIPSAYSENLPLPGLTKEAACNYHNYQLFKLIISILFIWYFYWLDCFRKTSLLQMDLKATEIVSKGRYLASDKKWKILLGKILILLALVCFLFYFHSKGKAALTYWIEGLLVSFIFPLICRQNLSPWVYSLMARTSKLNLI